jgi:hypothetical protein
MKYLPDKPGFRLPLVFRGAAHYLCARESALVGRRYVIFARRHEPRPSTGGELGISVENNSCAALMAKVLAKGALAARRTP